MAPASARPYPEGWEADVVLRDGRPVHIRPIRPDDGPALQRFHHGLSAQTVYFRYFAPRPDLSDEDLRRMTSVDYVDRMAFIVLSHGEIIGEGGYDRIDGTSAEVAFVIDDRHQGRGIGSVLLEHLVAVGREHGVERFVAEVLPQNAKMLATFTRAGFQVARAYDEGVVSVSFDLALTPDQRRVMEAREHRAEARSLAALLAPRAVAVVGASRHPGTVGHELLRHVADAGFTGLVYGVHPAVSQIGGIACLPSLADVPEQVDLVVAAVPASAVQSVVDEAATCGARGIVIVSGGFDEDAALQRRMVAAAREGGMRLVGPSALGLLNTDADVRLNASLVPHLPRRDSLGFFCQSGALGIDFLARLDRRGLGVSTFVSAGNRADVSGNDLLQYWEEDPDTDLVLLYLESIGNPGKFIRIARRVARAKPVIAVRSTGATRRHPLGHDVPVSDLDPRAFEQLLSTCGVIGADSMDSMLDVAEVLRLRGIPLGSRLGIVGNSDALALLARNRAEMAGLDVGADARTMPRESQSDAYRRILDDAGRDPEVDMILAVFVPPVESDTDAEVRDVIATCAAAIDKPTVAVVVGQTSATLRAAAAQKGAMRSLPVFTDVEHAVRALALAANYARWRGEPAGELLPEEAIDPQRAMAVLDAAGTSGALAPDAVAQLLDAYGIPLDVAPGVIRCRVEARVDPLVGPVVSVRLADPVSALLGDIAYGVPPLTDRDAQRMVDRLGGRPLLGSADAAGAVGSIVQRVGELLADQALVEELAADIEVGGDSAWAAAASARVVERDPENGMLPLRQVRRLGS